MWDLLPWHAGVPHCAYVQVKRRGGEHFSKLEPTYWCRQHQQLLNLSKKEENINHYITCVYLRK